MTDQQGKDGGVGVGGLSNSKRELWLWRSLWGCCGVLIAAAVFSVFQTWQFTHSIPVGTLNPLLCYPTVVTISRWSLHKSPRQPHGFKRGA